MKRCDWVTNDPLYIKYHDEEWGVPVFDDNKLFEFITLEGAQAGLSWITILKRREYYREAFCQFQIEEVARFSEEKVDQLMRNEKIIRNEKKIRSTITNARAILKIKKQYGSFSTYIWSFVDGKPIINHWTSNWEVPVQTELSKKMSKELKKHGFSFVGPITMYSLMQAVGMVNDHLLTCFCHPENSKLK